MISTPSSSADALISALQTSHAALAAAVTPLSATDLVRPAYPSEWSIAQVMSHLGSGAEIFSLFLTSVRTGGPTPEFDTFSAIWDVWNAKEPQDQTTDSLTADAAFLAQVTAMSAEEKTQFSVTMFNGEQDLTGFLRLRIGEHALHTWDVRVALDPSATLEPDATALILPGLGEMVARVGLSRDDELAVLISTEDPAGSHLLNLGPDGAQLTDGPADTSAATTLRLPAEALVRLVYGRLDPEHTPVVQADGVELEQLRQSFPGF